MVQWVSDVDVKENIPGDVSSGGASSVPGAVWASWDGAEWGMPKLPSRSPNDSCGAAGKGTQQQQNSLVTHLRPGMLVANEVFF